MILCSHLTLAILTWIVALGYAQRIPYEGSAPSRVAHRPPPPGEEILNRGACACPTTNPFASSGRIISGQAAAKPIPWQVLLDIGGGGTCGGTVVTNRFVVSAAHCFGKEAIGKTQFTPSQTTKIWAGTTKMSDGGLGGIGGQMKKVVKIHATGSYNKDSNANDIVIMQLDSDLTFNKDVQPACLPAAEPKVGTLAYVSGWGLKKFGAKEDLSLKLNWVGVPILANSVCQFEYPNPPFATKLQLCAGVKGSGKGSCQGDSGGPLVQFANGKAELVGIVSFGNACGNPGAYTRLTPYAAWIKKITASGCSATTAGTTAAPATSATSCKGRCGKEYDPKKTCQCDSGCASAEDCCADKTTVCTGG